jgi:hypothetical protein
MVRLVITDFASKDLNETFYLNDEFATEQNMFTYNSFKKYSVFLSRYETNDEIYSLNLLSKKHLGRNQFLIHIAENEYIILFNHKTVYSAKINQNFITDDMIKSILITKHIAMLSSGGAIENIYYVINSKYKSAIENILRQNTKNEKNEVVAKSLGEMTDLVKPLNELDTFKSHSLKMSYSIFMVFFVFWTIFFGLDLLTTKLFEQQSLDNLNKEINIESRLSKRQELLLNKSEKEYKELTQCISNKNEALK